MSSRPPLSLHSVWGGQATPGLGEGAGDIARDDACSTESLLPRSLLPVHEGRRAATAAWKPSSPWARSATMVPASTSPVPALANAALAKGSTTNGSSGAATTVKAPFRTTIWCQRARTTSGPRQGALLYLAGSHSCQPRHLARVGCEHGSTGQQLGPSRGLTQDVESIGIQDQGRKPAGRCSGLGRPDKPCSSHRATQAQETPQEAA